MRPIEEFPLPNVWTGVSKSEKKAANEEILDFIEVRDDGDLDQGTGSGDGWNRRIPDIFKIVVIRLGDDLNLCSEEDKYQQDLVGGWKWKRSRLG